MVLNICYVARENFYDSDNTCIVQNFYLKTFCQNFPIQNYNTHHYHEPQ